MKELLGTFFLAVLVSLVYSTLLIYAIPAYSRATYEPNYDSFRVEMYQQYLERNSSNGNTK